MAHQTSRTMFKSPVVQEHIATALSKAKTLTIFIKDIKEFYPVDELSLLQGSDLLYMMIGTSKNHWAFAPSFFNKQFRLCDGNLYTVLKHGVGNSIEYRLHQVLEGGCRPDLDIYQCLEDRI